MRELHRLLVALAPLLLVPPSLAVPDTGFAATSRDGPVATDAPKGWFEIERGESRVPEGGVVSTSAQRNEPGAAPLPGRGGDRLWMTRVGDSFASIAEATTGSARHAETIAAYNGLAANLTPSPRSLLFVPAALLTPARGGDVAPRSEIREFDDESIERVFPPADASDSGPAPGTSRAVGAASVERRPVSVDRHDVNMFVGEVQVLGEFDATRVAIGNGGIVRAEVLSSGELLVIAQSPGSTSLRLWHRGGTQSDFNIRVEQTDPETRVRMEKMIRMRVRMVEFRKSALGRLGIDWSDGASGPTFATAGDAIGNPLYRPPGADALGTLPNTVQPFSTYFGIASNITSRINFLASNGDAVTLAEPVLSTTNGGTASFLAGGEVPYPSVGANGQSIVQFKEYGIKLDVSPVVDAGGNVRTVVATEISQLDPAVSVQGAPGLLTRRAETEVNVRSGETIVISGLLSAESSKDIDRVPGIGRLPVIGSLFRSENTRNAISELVIFVTPEVLEPRANALSARERGVHETSSAHLERARTELPLME